MNPYDPPQARSSDPSGRKRADAGRPALSIRGWLSLAVVSLVLKLLLLMGIALWFWQSMGAS